MRRLLPILILIMTLPAIALAAKAPRDTLRTQGHDYRRWMYDMNSISDRNSNLDPKMEFVADGRIRVHPERVYFYTNIDLAIQIARETGYPLAFYLFDHYCKTCIYRLVEVYENPEVVEASQDFINVYVELPRQATTVNQLGMMNSNLTAQFFLPSMRRMRVLDNADVESLLTTYPLMLDYWESLTLEERLNRELELKKSRSAYK